jgi:peptidoglycan/LPS O-acetylase OafA/YrhL
MKRWLGLFAVLGVVAVAAFFISLHFRKQSPEWQYWVFSERCDQVQIGMKEKEVDVLFGLTPDRPRWGTRLPGMTCFLALYWLPMLAVVLIWCARQQRRGRQSP